MIVLNDAEYAAAKQAYASGVLTIEHKGDRVTYDRQGLKDLMTYNASIRGDVLPVGSMGAPVNRSVVRFRTRW